MNLECMMTENKFGALQGTKDRTMKDNFISPINICEILP